MGFTAHNINFADWDDSGIFIFTFPTFPTGREQEFQPSGTRIPGIENRGTNRREFPTHADDVFGKQPGRISRTPFFAPSVLSAALVFIVVQYY